MDVLLASVVDRSSTAVDNGAARARPCVASSRRSQMDLHESPISLSDRRLSWDRSADTERVRATQAMKHMSSIEMAFAAVTALSAFALIAAVAVFVMR
jgi:hypothetical protein